MLLLHELSREYVVDNVEEGVEIAEGYALLGHVGFLVKLLSLEGVPSFDKERVLVV